MTKDDFAKNGTGHILQDLLSSTVLLNRTSFIPPPNHNFPLKIEDDNSSPELRSSCCSICSESTNLSPLAVHEMEILAKFVLTQEQISLILQTEDHPPIFCCKICSSAILSLTKLTTQIENITISLRAVISSRNGLFNKLRNEYQINEFSHQVALGSGSPKIFRNDDDPCIEEEELPLKIEPTYDDDDDCNDITHDPLDMSENANADVEEEYVCKICQPNVTFLQYRNYLSHMRNKNIHAEIVDLQPRLAPKKFACRICNKKFTRNTDLRRHLRSTLHPGISDVDIAAASKRTQRSVPVKQDLFSCPICDKGFFSHMGLIRHKSFVHEKASFTRKCTFCPKVFKNLKLLQKHKHKRHNVPIPASPSQEGRHSCAMCPNTFATLINKDRHVEVFHFQDKTSCPYGCTTKFDSEADWVTHLEGCDSPKMSAESQRFCQYCPAVFRNVLLQMEHSFREHPEQCCPCSVCGKRFSCRSFLYDHECK